jgi:FMN reductase
MKIAILVGNPAPGSRTLRLAESVGAAIAPIVGATGSATIDLAAHAGAMFDAADAGLQALTQQVAASDLVVVATPTYKAAYTGLLKAFLDRYDTDALAGVVAVPVMTGGSPAHALAPDLSLRPLLVELGASVPTRSLYFMTSQMPQLESIVQAWAESNRAALLGAAAGRRSRPAS